MFAVQQQGDGELGAVIVTLLVIWAVVHRHRRRLSDSAFGTAFWMTERMLRRWGLTGNRGLVVARSLRGTLLRIRDCNHVLIIGGTGSGKTAGVITPNLLANTHCSVVVFDLDGRLHATTARRRRGKVIRLSPYGGGHRWNVLDCVGGPQLVDRAKALAESLVVRPPGGAHEPYWDDKAAQTIAAVLVFVLMRLDGTERSLNGALEILSDPAMLFGVAGELRNMGRVPRQMGNAVLALYDRSGLLTEHGASVHATAVRHLDFLNSDMVAASVEASDFDVRELLRPGVTLYLQIPVDMLAAAQGLVRCWVATLIREIGSRGDEANGEVLFLMDEASALNGLDGLQQALVRGRAAGIRLILAYQSDSQVQTAFHGKPSLIYDNCGTQVVLNASSIEAADRLSRSLGSWTQVNESYNDNWNVSQNTGGDRQGGSVSRGGGANYAASPRPLMFPDEVLRKPSDSLIIFHDGLPAPILARKIRYFADPAFTRSARRPRRKVPWQWVLFGVLGIGLAIVTVRAKVERRGYWAPPQNERRYVPTQPTTKQSKPTAKAAAPGPRRVTPEPKRR